MKSVLSILRIKDEMCLVNIKNKDEKCLINIKNKDENIKNV